MTTYRAGRDFFAENELAVAFRDKHPVTPLHTLIVSWSAPLSVARVMLRF
jgi:diadenosine tetraphosphate (Ap4A) HIT family hydrolase